MGAEYRDGEYYGSSTTINDNVISKKSTWSSEKIAGQIDDISVTGNKTWSSWEINSRINEKADSSVIAPVETDVIASRAYAIGEHFIKNGKFCTAKTAIAQNEAFTLNTNYTAGDIDDDIKALKDRVTALENRITTLETEYSGYSTKFKHYQLINDWNKVTTAGWYTASNAANMPPGKTGWMSGICIPANNDVNYAMLIALSISDNHLYIRHCGAGTWGAWVVI